LTRRLLAAGVAPAVGLRPGFDVALHRLAVGAGRPAVAVASTGLAKVDGSVRPGATALVRAGGVMLSPFPMDHGPFDHDEYERALVQAAISRVVAAFAPEAGGPSARALAWAVEAGRPAYCSGEPDEGPAGAVSLDEPGSLDAAVAAALR
jgi:predicted Rossmann fold nucleotide-binding protein DprA/Smf involved in DNA uptake